MRGLALYLCRLAAVLSNLAALFTRGYPRNGCFGGQRDETKKLDSDVAAGDDDLLAKWLRSRRKIGTARRHRSKRLTEHSDTTIWRIPAIHCDGKQCRKFRSYLEPQRAGEHFDRRNVLSSFRQLRHPSFSCRN